VRTLKKYRSSETKLLSDDTMIVEGKESLYWVVADTCCL
jgi:hypothetical protein